MDRQIDGTHSVNALPKARRKLLMPRDNYTPGELVQGISKEVDEQTLKSYFAGFGRVLDADLPSPHMGLGLVVFDGEAAVDATLAHALQILGKPIEVMPVLHRSRVRKEGNPGVNYGHNLAMDWEKMEPQEARERSDQRTNLAR